MTLDLRSTKIPSFSKEDRILPLLVQKGLLWRSLSNASYFVAPPFLGTDEDLHSIAIALDHALPKHVGSCYLLVAHGEKEKKIEEYNKLSLMLREDIHITTLHSPLPPLEGHVVVLPFLLSFGHHAKEEIERKIVPSIEGSLLIEKGLISLLPEVKEIFLKHLRMLLE